MDSPSALPFSKLAYPITGHGEFLIYRDEESFESWQEHGATSENQSSLLHLIVTPDGVTIIVDQVDSSLADLARELLESVQRNRIAFHAA